MDKMNLFDHKGESSKMLFNESKTIITLPDAPIQNAQGILKFKLGDFSYTVIVDSEKSREKCKKKIYKDTGKKYDWIRENNGQYHWVLYDTEMYTPAADDFYGNDEYYDPEENEHDFLTYRCDENSEIAPSMPINATSCFRMFTNSDRDITSIDFSQFNTCNIEDMSYMFAGNKYLVSLDLSNFKMEKVEALSHMFDGCISLSNLVISNWNLNEIQIIHCMFGMCISLKKLDLSSWKLNTALQVGAFDTFYACTLFSELKVNEGFLKSIAIYDEDNLFTLCHSLPNFSTDKTVTELFKPIEEGGCLTVVK